MNKRMALLFASGLIACLLLRDEAVAAYSWIRVTANTSGLATTWNLSQDRVNVKNGRVLYVIGSDGTLDDVSGELNEFQAVQASFTAWRNIRESAIDFEFDGYVDEPVADGDDDINMVFWDTSGSMGGDTFAETTTTHDTVTGELLDADLVFNDGRRSGGSKYFVWDTLDPGDSSGQVGLSYIQTIGIHEIGHFIGLDHTYVPDATMFPFFYPGSISPVSLAREDTSPITDAYADDDMPSTLGSVSGRVSSGGTGRFGVNVTLVDTATGEAIISALSDRDTDGADAGDFEITGVPRGNYWVIASKIFPEDLGSYYASSFTSLAPTLLGVATGVPSMPTVLQVAEGEHVQDVEVEVSTLTSPYEANNASTSATAIEVGDALGARIESGTDVDYFSLTLQANETLHVHVYSDVLGQDPNLELALFDNDGTSVLVTGEFGHAKYNASARDLQSSAYGLQALNFDAAIAYEVDGAGTYYLRVRSSNDTDTGDYVLVTWSDLTHAEVDSNQSDITSSLAGGLVGAADFTVTVTPRNALGEAFANADSFEVELIDLGNGNAVLDVIDGSGPYVFTVSPPAVAETLELGARIDGVLLDALLELPFTSAVSAAHSSLNIVATSLVRDGTDESEVIVVLRDSAERQVFDASLEVELVCSTGTLIAGAESGATVTAEYNDDTGLYTATVRAPTAGSSLEISAMLSGTEVGSESIDLTRAVDGDPDDGDDGGNNDGGGTSGGGCGMVGNGVTLVPLVMLLALMALRRRRLKHFSFSLQQ